MGLTLIIIKVGRGARKSFVVSVPIVDAIVIIVIVVGIKNVDNFTELKKIKSNMILNWLAYMVNCV